MEIFDNCRICLREINHEPIKITRLILQFLGKSLHLTYVTKPKSQENVKQNLCAACFNKISEFQDFYEQCRDSDEFWKTQFDVLKENFSESQFNFEQTVLLPLTEDSSSLEADTTVTIAEENKQDVANLVQEDDDIISTEEEIKKDMLTSTLPPLKEGDNGTQIGNFNQSIDLTNWSDDINNDKESDIHIVEEEEKIISTKCTEELIEYEYQIEENEEIEIEEEFLVAEETESSVDVDYRSFEYEKIETEALHQSTTTTIHQTTLGSVEEQSTNTNQNSFFMATTIDENGKSKTIYKCQYCDKTFNRVYDIESHYNIHNGIKPYTCQVCGKSFRQKNILTTHQALHFGKKVECTECGKKFARRSQLILHYRMHRNEKPFVCNYEGCNAAFRQRKQLIDHSFIHSGEKNFQCTTCTKSFHTRKRLQDHIYKVHSQHRYRCELCNKAFLKPHMLKHHTITAHNVEMDDVSHLKTLVDDLKPTSKKVTKQI